ncbi:MAG: amino acid racemase [Ferruginibacter sp.]
MNKTIGICAHSYEGGSLCFITTCREGAALLGPHMHPPVILSAVPMALSMPGWESDNYDEVGKYLYEGIEQVAKAGADFFICPDNTAHIVLERMITNLPLPGLHIAEVVCKEIVSNQWKKVALLGTKWTMNGPVYLNAMKKNDLVPMVPGKDVQDKIHNAIFDELCQGIFLQKTIDVFIDAIESLKNEGAEAVILGCTEIPLIINAENSSLPTLDSTRLLAKYAVKLAVSGKEIEGRGWVEPV